MKNNQKAIRKIKIFDNWNRNLVTKRTKSSNVPLLHPGHPTAVDAHPLFHSHSRLPQTARQSERHTSRALAPVDKMVRKRSQERLLQSRVWLAWCVTEIFDKWKSSSLLCCRTSYQWGWWNGEPGSSSAYSTLARPEWSQCERCGWGGGNPLPPAAARLKKIKKNKW